MARRIIVLIALLQGAVALSPSFGQQEKVSSAEALKRLESLGATVSAVLPGQNVLVRGKKLEIGEKWKGAPGDIQILSSVTDVDLYVRLSGNKITPEFLHAISKCERVFALDMYDTKITDEAFAKLKGLNLAQIDVRYTPITEVSLPTLASLKSAKTITLFGTKISPEHKDALREKLPHLLLLDIRNGALLGVGPLNQFQPDPNACVIGRPAPDSAAERGGLIQDDVILKYGDKPVKNFDDLKMIVGESKPGDEIKITIKRKDQELEKTITLGKFPFALNSNPPLPEPEIEMSDF